VVDITGRGGYSDGFDRTAEYEFMRIGETETARFRMADQSPHFNIAGLLWRPLPKPPKQG
jgi:hypothetical protein